MADNVIGKISPLHCPVSNDKAEVRPPMGDSPFLHFFKIETVETAMEEAFPRKKETKNYGKAPFRGVFPLKQPNFAELWFLFFSELFFLT